MRSDISLKQRIIRRYSMDGGTKLLRYALRTGIRRLGLFPRFIQLRQMKQKVLGYTALAAPFKILYINPSEINHYTLDFNTYRVYSKIKGGDWDTSTQKFDNLAKFKAIKKKHEEKIGWEETEIYDEMMGVIEKKGVIDGCRNKQDLKKRYNEIGTLYENIKNNGYKESRSLSEGERKNKGDINNICVNIARDGKFIFQGDGFHRLSIAKVLDLDKIPVQVALRHKEWQHHREKVNKENTSVEPEHPDLQDLRINC